MDNARAVPCGRRANQRDQRRVLEAFIIPLGGASGTEAPSISFHPPHTSNDYLPMTGFSGLSPRLHAVWSCPALLERPGRVTQTLPGYRPWYTLQRRSFFAGSILGAISYGVVIVLFFRCMTTLSSPVNSMRQGVRWGLVAYTTAMFSFVTVYIAMTLEILSVSFIENRHFPGSRAVPPGPLGHQLLLYSSPIYIVPNLMFLLNNWLADGLLLYRCYVIYSKNTLVIAFPGVMYLTLIAMGIAVDYNLAQTNSITRNATALFNLGISYFSIAILLNVILTLMIVTRLYLHNRKIQSTMGASARASGLCMSVATMLIESCAIYAVALLLYLVPWGAKKFVQDIFWPLVANIEVIAPFLIILRVANRSAFSGDVVFSDSVGPIKFRSQLGSTGGRAPTPGEYSTTSTDAHGKHPGERTIEIVQTIELNHDTV